MLYSQYSNVWRFTLSYFITVGLALAVAAPAEAQIGYFQEISVPNDSAYVYIGTGFFYYEGEQVVLRGGQQSLAFDVGQDIFQFMKVRIDGGPWIFIFNGSRSRTGIYEWNSPPTAVGSYDVEVAYGSSNSNSYEFDLFVVPPANRAFLSHETVPGGGTLKHTMLVWSGTDGGGSLDKPLFVIEGIDGANENDPGSYYAIGADPSAALFPRGQAEGADIVILDFGDGGRDLRANAAVVQEAISYLRVTKTDPNRGLDVAGVSMGGVVARYALAKMEQENDTHGVANFVSIDAPQQGAIVHGTLQHDIKARAEPADWPPSIARLAGQQLLQYSAFDTTNPTEHQRFFSDLEALNGGVGYPQLTQNVGVSFGTPNANPNPNQRWLRLDVSGLCDLIEWGWPDCDDHDYDVVGNLALAGSYLPKEVTRFWGRRAWGTVRFELLRYDPVHPVFIPYVSALDIDPQTGQSEFQLPLIHANATPSFHNVVPPEIVGPLLNRLGYELPPPTTVSITGPSAIATQQTGTWQAVVPDPEAGYQYNWEYMIYLPSCGGGNGGPEQIPCGEWHDGYGSGAIFTYSSQTSLWLNLRVTATGGGGSATSSIKAVCVGNCSGARYAADGTGLESGSTTEPTSALVSSATATSSLADSTPLTFALEPNYPNPFGPGVGTSTRALIRFTLPEALTAQLVVYDALGREVARPFEGRARIGRHEVVFDAANLAGGVYVYRLSAGNYAETRQLTLIK